MNIEENLDQIRAEFDLLKYWIYLNAADQMIPGNYWLKAVRDFFDFQERGQMEDIPVSNIATHPFLTSTYYECIERAARLIHANKEEVTNCYRPIQVANMIVNDLLAWRSGDNVVFTDLCYPSFPFIFLELQKRFGVELRKIKHVKGEILLSDLEKQIDDRTKLISINRTTAFCGFTFDVKEVCEIAHQHGALVMDDAFQALGAIDIDVHADDVDLLISGSYKWQGGPEGAGLFYIRKDLIDKFNPKFRNYLAVDLP
ncbi:MAG: aminotransferase class V-fold PLP-dependent enzyme, partial [bacterium]